jgi:hypothetical protein
MNPAGIAMFYGAEDSEAVLAVITLRGPSAELRREGLHSAATVGTWTEGSPLSGPGAM